MITYTEYNGYNVKDWLEETDRIVNRIQDFRETVQDVYDSNSLRALLQSYVIQGMVCELSAYNESLLNSIKRHDEAIEELCKILESFDIFTGSKQEIVEKYEFETSKTLNAVKKKVVNNFMRYKSLISSFSDYGYTDLRKIINMFLEWIDKSINMIEG